MPGFLRDFNSFLVEVLPGTQGLTVAVVVGFARTDGGHGSRARFLVRIQLFVLQLEINSPIDRAELNKLFREVRGPKFSCFSPLPCVFSLCRCAHLCLYISIYIREVRGPCHYLFLSTAFVSVFLSFSVFSPGKCVGHAAPGGVWRCPPPRCPPPHLPLHGAI